MKTVVSRNIYGVYMYTHIGLLIHLNTPMTLQFRVSFNKMENKTNTMLSEQFQIPIDKSQKEAKPTPLTQTRDCLLSWLGAGTSIKCGGVKLA